MSTPHEPSISEPSQWVPAGHAARAFFVTANTIRRWAREGRLPSIAYPRAYGRDKGQRDRRLFDISALHAGPRVSGSPSTEPTETEGRTEEAIYARVSTPKQKEDLERQINALQRSHPQAVVYRDICSGLNFKRPGLHRLLGRIFEGRVRQVHVAHRDRLCRFGYDLLTFVCGWFGTTITVESSHDTPPSLEGELSADILSILTVFGARLHGSRSHDQALSIAKIQGLSSAEAENATAKRQKLEHMEKKRETVNENGRKRSVRGTKNPLQPNQELRTYKIRLHPTPDQENRLKNQWFRAARDAYNYLLGAVQRRDLPCTPESVNRLARPTPSEGHEGTLVPCLPPWIHRQHRCIYKNAMLDLVASMKANETVQRKNPAHRWTNKFRSLRGDPTECIRLDAAKFRPEDREGREKPKDAGPSQACCGNVVCLCLSCPSSHSPTGK